MIAGIENRLDQPATKPPAPARTGDTDGEQIGMRLFGMMVRHRITRRLAARQGTEAAAGKQPPISLQHRQRTAIGLVTGHQPHGGGAAFAMLLQYLAKTVCGVDMPRQIREGPMHRIKAAE